MRKELLGNLTADCKVGWVKLRSNVSKEHLFKQIEVALERINLGHEVIIEAHLISGGKIDVLDITSMTAYEILKSEKKEQAMKKVKKYPEYLDIEFINC